MRLKLQVLGITLFIMLFATVFTLPQSYAVTSKEPPPASYIRFSLFSQEGIDYPRSPLTTLKHRFSALNKLLPIPMDVDIGFALPTSLPILSQFKLQIGCGFYHYARDYLYRYYLTSTHLGLYYDLFQLFNLIPYVGFRVGYIRYKDIDYFVSFGHGHLTVSHFSAGVRFNLPKTPFALFAEYNRGISIPSSFLFHPPRYFRRWMDFIRWVPDASYLNAGIVINF